MILSIDRYGNTMNIVTVRWGNKFSYDYVTALRAQVPNVKILTDEDGSLLEPKRFTGWFSKLEVFRPENKKLRPCLFLDLPTFVMKSLRPFHRLDNTKLWLIRDFNNHRKSNSGIFIAPKHGISDEIWSRVRDMDAYNGDGDFLSTFEHSILQDSVSGIMSYKSDWLYDDPGDARVISFHGRPKPHQTEGWALEMWLQCTKT